MAVVYNVNKSLLATPATRHFLFKIYHSSASSRPDPIMLHNSILQNYPVLRCSPYGSGNNFEKYNQLEFRKVQGFHTIQANSLTSEKNFHLFQTYPDNAGSSLAIQPLLRIGIPHTMTAKCFLGYRPVEVSFRFIRRSFSQVPRSEINENSNADVTGKNLSIWKVFSKPLRLTKKLAAQGKNHEQSAQVAVSNKEMEKGVSNSKILAQEKVDIDTSSDMPIADNKELVNLVVSCVSDRNSNLALKGKGKPKQLSRSKKGERQSSAGANEPKSCQGISKAQKRRLKKQEECTMASESSATENVPVEVLDSSVSTDAKSQKMANNSLRGKNPIKEASAPSKCDQDPKVSSCTELPEKQLPFISGNTKLQKQRTLPKLYPPNCKSVLVVESMTKAKVIQGYLGDMFEVLPSFGHVRDLAARSGSVRPDDDFSMVWEVPSAAWTHLKSIKVALSGAKNLILASDPDREGEAIAWHIIEMLQQQDALSEGVNVARVVFNEITESSIKSALQTPRHINVNLVHAYLARRALDYLIGFNISPLLWRKLPGCQSAGRVQSAALALICDREMEIDEYRPQEYWTVEVGFSTKKQVSSTSDFLVSSYLTHFDSRKLNQFSIRSHVEASAVDQKINSSNFVVVNSKRSKVRKNPPPPYITSTLQQDAANKLNFTAIYTMKLAQKLYEGIQLSDGKASGLITYMRTDGLHISDEAVKDVRSLIIDRYGQHFASANARKYFKKVKNAQEAHEAIRPTSIWRLPSMLVGMLDEDSLKLYTLIWSRTVAFQMELAIVEQIQVDIGNFDQSIVLRSACSRVDFSGYRAVFEDVETKVIGYDEDEENDRNEVYKVLSTLKTGDALCLGKVELNQHHTEPPPRYSEGSLVKKLEELGIGRPSTYAVTIKVLKDRNYMTAKGRTLYPEFRGRMVSAYLSHHFTEVTDYSFTADMETELDNISSGLTDWKGLLRDYWARFSKYCERASNVHIHQVEQMLEKTFANFLFASLPDRTCPSCSEGNLIFKVSRFGAGYFVGCDQHPKCKYISKTLCGNDDEEPTPQENQSVEEPKLLGLHPSSNEKVLLKNGPYGFYVQLGEDRKGYLPKRASVSQIKNVDSITLEDALEVLCYPVTLGNHPEDGHPVVLKLAKHGFSIRHRRNTASVPKNLKPGDITLEKALKFLLGKDVKRSGRPKGKRKLEEEALEV